MARVVFFLLFVVGLPLVIDYYVYRNWRRFARVARGGRLRWTLPVYRVLLFTMPLVPAVYMFFSNWWEVEPKLLRALVIGFWSFYYVPKIIIAGALLLKDALRFAGWLFRWFQARLRPGEHEAAEPLDLADMRQTSRRDFLQKLGWTAATVPFVVVGYSIFRTLYDFEVYRVDVVLPNLPRAFDGLTMAQLSDLHVGSLFSTRPLQDVVAQVHELQPDVITITGDFVNNDAGELTPFLPILKQFRADLGVFGCLGNHEHYAHVPTVMNLLAETPVQMLVNARHTFEIDGAHLHLLGTDNTGFYQDYGDLPRALAGLSAAAADDPRILLSHTPSYWESHVRPGHPDIDLMLCGHTHGGQVGFEWGPLRYSVAQVMYPRWAGLYAEPRAGERGPQYLYVNRGIGTVGPPLRLGIRPEITLLTLRRA